MTITMIPEDDAAKRRDLFTQLVEPRIPSIRRLVAGLTFPGEDVDDNLQEVLIKLFLFIGRYDPAQPFTPWLDTLVRNHMVSLHRHHAACGAGDIDFTDDDEALDAHPADDSPALPFAFDDDWRPDRPVPPLSIARADYPRTYDALMSLTALQRRALLLLSEGWTAPDIAREFRLSPANVRQIIHRARTAMAAALGSEECAPRSARPLG